jgi:hypothetical protein
MITPAYVIIVEYEADDHNINSVAFYASEASYAASLAKSFNHSQTIFSPSQLPHLHRQLVPCRIRTVVYAAI